MISRPTSEITAYTLPTDLERVEGVVLGIASWLEQHGIEGKPLFKAQLLLEETITNVVRHGFGGDPSHEVRVWVELSLGSIRITVEDDGPAFDPLGDGPAVDTQVPLIDRPLGGLGLHLIKTMASDVAYLRAGAVNRLAMRVDLAAA